MDYKPEIKQPTKDGNKNASIHVKMPAKYVEEINAIAEANKTSRSYVIRELISHYLQMHEKVSVEKVKADGDEYSHVFVLMTKKLKEQIRKVANEKRLNVSKIVKFIVKKYLEE